MSAYTPRVSWRIRRPRHDGRACPCERMPHDQVCALESLHTLTLVARPKTAPRRQGFSLQGMLHAQVCALERLHTLSLVVYAKRPFALVLAETRPPRTPCIGFFGASSVTLTWASSGIVTRVCAVDAAAWRTSGRVFENRLPNILLIYRSHYISI